MYFIVERDVFILTISPTDILVASPLYFNFTFLPFNSVFGGFIVVNVRYEQLLVKRISLIIPLKTTSFIPKFVLISPV